MIFPAGTHPQPGAASGFQPAELFGFRKTHLGLDLLAGGYEENPRGLAELSWSRSVCLFGEVTLFSFLPPEKPAKDYEFAQILKRSICLEQNTQAWCENCEKYQPTVRLGGGHRHEGLWDSGVRGAVCP